MPKKTVVVGMGGTGDWVLTFLKSRLYAAYGEQQVHDDVQFLLLDTIHEDTRESAFETEEKKFRVQSAIDQHEEEVAHLAGVRVEAHEYLPLTGELQQVARAISAREPDRRHLNWFAADYFLDQLPPAAMNITDGAGQWRQFGRIALTLSAERLEFPKRVAKLIESARAGNDTLMFYLISSLAGGTGAGLFLDAAAIIRHVAEQNRQKVWLVGFLVLPSAFKRVLGATTMELTKTRSYAAYREMLRFQTQPGKRVPYTIPYSLNFEVRVDSKLFDTTFLFDADTGRFSEVPPWQGISPSIADGLEVFIDRTAGSAILQDLINASASLAGEVQMGATLPAQFHTMGSHKIVLPARQFAARYCSRFVIDLLDRLFPREASGEVEVLRRAPRTEAEYRAFVVQFVRKIPNLFTQIVDMLPDNPDHVKKLRGFATRRLEEYGSLLRPKKTPQGADLQWFLRDPLKDVQTGKVAGDDAESAARRIVRDCERNSRAYLERLDQILETVLDQLGNEIPGELQQQVFDLLNGRIAEFSEFTFGSTLEFLAQVESLCNDLKVRVLKQTSDAIDNQRGGQNSAGYWQSFLSEAQSNLDGTHGFDSFFKRGKAYDAQKAYIEASRALLERTKLARLFGAFDRIVDLLKAETRQLHDQLEQWIQRAVLGHDFSARLEATREIAELENGLLDAGQTFTSSYGLKRYQPGTAVDPSLGGYREKQYEKLVAPLLDRWLRSPEWSVQSGEDGDHLVLNLPSAGPEGFTLTAPSGKALNQTIYRRVWDEIGPQVVGLSVFDYFIQSGHKPSTVAEYLLETTKPLFGQIRTIERAEASHQLHLLAQQPDSEEGARFLHELRSELEKRTDQATLQKAQRQDFDNPYVLTLLYLVKDVRDGQIRVMEEYRDQYYGQLRERDVHLVNHVFQAEQRAASIEKEVLVTTGKGSKQLAPRIVRLLEQSGRLIQFLGLWALGIVRLEQNPTDRLQQVWMVLPPEADDPQGPRAIWLTVASNREPSVELSPLLAMEQFCFEGKSAREGYAIPIDYDALQRDLTRQRNSLIDGPEAGDPYGRLIRHYEDFLKQQLEPKLDRVGSLHREEEVSDLKLVCRYFLDGELGALRKRL